MNGITNPPPLAAGPPPTLNQDAEHLKLLAIFHYILGAITLVFSCFGLIYLFLGIMALTGNLTGTSAQEAELMGWLFTSIGGGITLLGWIIAVCQILTGRWLSARRRRGFCFVIACIECLNMPLGTALGVFTILVLQRPSVRALFDNQASTRSV